MNIFTDKYYSSKKIG